MINLAKEYIEAWQKIKDFQLDEPGIAFPFSKKLAKENNWSVVFTERAIEEYKRFILLCVVSPTGASPSPIVDKVWHLHLTYTKSYWEDLCNKSLNKLIHHHPTKGGAEEKDKHTDWYNYTINYYTKVFGEMPPTDIWATSESIKAAEDATQIDLPNYSFIKTAVLLFILPFALIFIFYNQPVPFLLNGNHFLIFYFLLSATAIVAMYSINRNMSKAIMEIVEQHYPKKYSIYEAMHFLFGRHAAVQTAIVDLLKKDVIETCGNYFINKVTESDLLSYKNPLIPKLFQHKDEKLSYKTMAFMLDGKSVSNPSFTGLHNFANKRTHWQAIVYLSVLLIGVARIFQGSFRDKPVGFLVLSIVVFTFAYWIIFCSTGKKEIVLKACKQKFEQDSLNSMDLQPHDEILRNFSISGVNALSGFKEYTVLAAMFAAYPFMRSFGSSDSGFLVAATSSCSSDGGCGGCGGD